jgi:hypothetical protein
MIACGSNNSSKEISVIPPPPKPNFDSLCNIYKMNTYSRLKKTGIELVFRDTIWDTNRDIIFDEVLKKEFNLEHFYAYDTIYYKHCVSPIMDSALMSIYGKNAKDSIIQVCYRMTDSIMMSEN